MRTALLAVLVIVMSVAAPAWAAAPQAVIDGPSTIATGEPIGFDGGGSSDPDGDQLSYAWSIDGMPLDVEHDWLAVSFAHPGEHVVALSVTDPTGASTRTQHPVRVTGDDRDTSGLLPFATSALQLPSTTPQLVVRPLAVKVARHMLRLTVRCRNVAVCRGHLRAVALVGALDRPLLLAHRRFTVLRGGPRVVRLRLTKAARQRMARHPRVLVTAYRGKVRVAHIWTSTAYRVG